MGLDPESHRVARESGLTCPPLPPFLPGWPWIVGETKSQMWDRPSPMGAVELNHDVTLKSQPHPCVIEHRPLWDPDVLI